MRSIINNKYLLTNEEDTLWGLKVHTVGYQSIEKHTSYPPRIHPETYLFSTDRGRILNEYQLLYISHGKGHFKSVEQKKTEICEGMMFLLFPGEWHTYKPDYETGWDEYWIGFSGEEIDKRVEHGFFSKQQPLFTVGIRTEIVQLYQEAISVAKLQSPGYQQVLAGFVGLLLGYAYAQNKHTQLENQDISVQINKAKILMTENFQSDIKPEEIAERLHVSYSWFRRMFKQYTGFAPSHYILELKIHKSKELLTNSMKSSQEIAFESGFLNADYFCTVFKKKVGQSPIQYRNFSQGQR